MSAPGQCIGTVRMSTTDQNTARQLGDIDVDRMFIDMVPA